MELIKDNVKIEWADLGEGLSGDYNPDDPNDIALLRFDVYVQSPEDGEWLAVDDASYCTLVPADSSEELLMKLLERLMSEIYDWASSGHSIKKLCERLSWISPAWIKNPSVNFTTLDESSEEFGRQGGKS